MGCEPRAGAMVLNPVRRILAGGLLAVCCAAGGVSVGGEPAHATARSGPLKLAAYDLCAEAAGSAVVLRDCDGSAAQNWTWNADDGNIVSPAGACLNDAANREANGNRIQLYRCESHPGDAPGNHWVWDAAREVIRYQPNPRFCLAVPSATAAGKQVMLWQCEPGVHWQRWTIGALLPPAPPLTLSTGPFPADGTFHGTGNPGARVEVTTRDPAAVCTATVAGSGAWQCRPGGPLAPGTHCYTATQTVSGGTSDPDEFCVVVPEPAQPAVTGASDQILHGTGEPGGRITLTTAGGTELCSATVTAAGTWHCDLAVTLAPGCHHLTVRQEHGATTRTGPPYQVCIPDPVTAGAGHGDLSGTAPPGTAIEVTDTSGHLECAATADRRGHWACTPRVSPGCHVLEIHRLRPSGTQTDGNPFLYCTTAQIATGYGGMASTVAQHTPQQIPTASNRP